MYPVLWLTLLSVAKQLKTGSCCITLSCTCKSFIDIKSAMGAFCPQTPNHLNQSCFLQQIKFSGLHNTTLSMQSFTCYYVSDHSESFLAASSEIKFPASLSSCVLLLSSSTSTAVHILLHILTLIVFSSFFLYIFSWLTCENELDNRKTEDWERPKTSKAAIGEL